MPIRYQSNLRKPYQNQEARFYRVGNRTIFFRSKMEANYALYLEHLRQRGEILEWQYEARTFIFDGELYGVRSYKPDFMVTRKNGAIEWHECKGYFDKDSRTKLKLMEKHYPKEKVIVVDNKAYMGLWKYRRALHWY